MGIANFKNMKCIFLRLIAGKRGESMFGFSKDILLKKEVLYYLDRQTDYVSSQELAAEIGNITSQTILKYIKELEHTLSENYDPSQMSLQINKRFGIKLLRYNTNFSRVLESLYSSSSVYVIFQTLMQSRQAETSQLCETLEISLSNLKRIIKRINQSIATYGLRITVGSSIKMTGKESNIRFVFFLFLYYVHHSYTKIPWIEDPFHVVRAKAICSTLYIEPKPILIELIALWLYINEISNKLGFSLESMNLATYFNDSIIEKHRVSGMNLEEWYFFLMSLYALDILNLSLFLNFEKIHNHPYTELANTWTWQYQEYFSTLSTEDQIWVRLTFQKCAILKKFNLMSQELSHVFSPISYYETALRYPEFIKKFEVFYSEITDLIGKSDQEYFKIKSLDLCLRFTSPKQMAMNITVSLMTPLSSDAANRIKRQLKNSFLNRINLSFSDDIGEVDVILTTEEFLESPKFAGKEILVIRPVLSSQDLQFIEERLYALRTTKNAKKTS